MHIMINSTFYAICVCNNNMPKHENFIKSKLFVLTEISINSQLSNITRIHNNLTVP